MARQNPRATSKRVVTNRADATVNEEGGLAFQMEPELELYTRVATALVGEPKFYDTDASGDDEIRKLIGVVAETNPQLILDLAIYARHELYLRTVPLVLLVESCKYPKTKALVRQAVRRVVTRADQLTELVAIWKKAHGDIGDHKKGGMLSNPLKRGIADAFENFDAYGFAKYDRDGEVKLRDVLRIAHPKPKTPERAALYKQVLDRTLPPPDTWEVLISGKGSTKENWEAAIPNMGYMALLRNLRNLLDKGVDVSGVIKTLSDPERVRKSKQFPFRFFSAYRELEGHQNPQTPLVLDALEMAIRSSVLNLPHLSGVTFLSADNSGSMQKTVSEKSKVTMSDTANVLQALASHICDQAITSVFGEGFAVVPTMKTGSLLQAVQRYKDTNVGFATNAFLALDYLTQNAIAVDRIIILSDMQCYDSAANDAFFHTFPQYAGYRGNSLAQSYLQYVSKIGKTPWLYSIDLAGYGTAQFPPGGKTALLAGWSDRVLAFFDAFEKTANPNVVFDAIRASGTAPQRGMSATAESEP